MTKEKWYEIFNEEYNKANECITSFGSPSPSNWKDIKNGMLLLIEGMDEATEVYEMENDK